MMKNRSLTATSGEAKVHTVLAGQNQETGDAKCAVFIALIGRTSGIRWPTSAASCSNRYLGSSDRYDATNTVAITSATPPDNIKIRFFPLIVTTTPPSGCVPRRQFTITLQHPRQVRAASANKIYGIVIRHLQSVRYACLRGGG